MSPNNTKRISILWIGFFLAVESFGQVWINTNTASTSGPIPGASPSATLPNSSILYMPSVVKVMTNLFLHDDLTTPLHERLAQFNYVPVICSGGWLYPNFFTLETYAYATTGAIYGATSQYNSVNVQWRAGNPKGVVLNPTVIHHEDWSGFVTYTNMENLTVESNVANRAWATWVTGLESGAVGRATAVLGDFTKSVELAFNGYETTVSNLWWVSDVAGSYRAAVNEAVSNLAWAANKQASIYSPWPYDQTNFIRNTNCWAAGIDLTCASPWNSAGIYYYAGTLVTPQHFLYAVHWSAPTGTVFRWIDATNGVHVRTLVDQRFLDNDVAVGRLDSELPSSITPATLLSNLEISRLRGHMGLRGCPGFRVVYLDAQERAWQATSSFMEQTGFNYNDFASFQGSTNWPFSKYGATGGDSGNPVFLTDGTNVTLLSTFYTANGGPMLANYRENIEAAIADMGETTHTNLTAPDLSGWPNYDEPLTVPDI